MSVTRKRLAKSREAVFAFRQIPNIGPAMEKDFRRLEIDHRTSSRARIVRALPRLNTVTGVRRDRLVLDTFIAAVRYMEARAHRGGSTKERKRRLGTRRSKKRRGSAL